MGCSQCNCRTDSGEGEDSLAKLKRPSSRNSVISVFSDHYCSNIELKFRTKLMKMIRDFGLACFLPSRSSREEIGDVGGEKSNTNLEHNKAWLLAESGGGYGAEIINGEPNSVHSSFRFSFCSQVELDSINMNSAPSTTILLVNLDNNWTDSRSRELKMRRMESLERNISPVTGNLIRFSYAEIVSATRKFSQGRVLGRGGLSYVFRGRVGFLRTAVAIKRLDKEDKESSKAFCRELMIASSLQHPNVVPLLGFCIDPEQGLFLVYKYVSSGSLEHHLHEKKGGIKEFASFPWSIRYKVAIGIAEAIAYLHHGTERCIVHRDIKPSNILLSSKKRPKLCDFGLAAWTTAPSVPFLCKTVKGTFGYLAPEYFQHGKVSDKTDVYAFGVVLLELITGRKPIEAKRPPGEENLVQWAKPLLDQGSTATECLIDPRAKLTPKSSAQINRMARAAAACLNCEESCRAGIDEVIALLRGEELSCPINRRTGSLRYAANFYSQVHRTKSEIRNHFALAMLGVNELEDDDYFYGR
ncbi:hypothetical protein Ancab_006426 [Ancistrocladus abbreviatus]